MGCIESQKLGPGAWPIDLPLSGGSYPHSSEPHIKLHVTGSYALQRELFQSVERYRMTSNSVRAV